MPFGKLSGKLGTRLWTFLSSHPSSDSDKPSRSLGLHAYYTFSELRLFSRVGVLSSEDLEKVGEAIKVHLDLR
jgi:hypothetical protein